MAPLKLYTHPFAYNATRVEILLAEMGVSSEVELARVNFWDFSFRTPDFLSKSKWGQLPLLEDSDTGIAVSESRAIARYLALKFAGKGTALVPGPTADIREHARFEEAMCFESLKVDPHATPLAWLKVGAPAMGQPLDVVRIKYHAGSLNKNLDVIDDILASRRYMAGDAFSLADICYMPLLYIVYSTCDTGLFDSRKNLARWWAEVSARESWKGAVGPLDAEWQDILRKGLAKQQAA